MRYQYQTLNKSLHPKDSCLREQCHNTSEPLCHINFHSTDLTLLTYPFSGQNLYKNTPLDSSSFQSKNKGETLSIIHANITFSVSIFYLFKLKYNIISFELKEFETCSHLYNMNDMNRIYQKQSCHCLSMHLCLKFLKNSFIVSLK